MLTKQACRTRCSATSAQTAKRWRRCVTAVARSARCTPWTTGGSLPNCSSVTARRYARYDYLEDRGLISPRITMILQPDSKDSLKVRTTVMHREVAPGAEEFIPPSVGLWLPPERTFSQVSRAAFLPERHDQVEIAVDRQWAEHVIVGFRAFTEQVEDQVVTIFGVSLPDAPAEVGHYQVGSAGDFAAHGWGVTFTRTVGENTRATVDYTQAQTRWRGHSADTDLLRVIAPSVMRSDERIHDVTASLESVVAPSATRLLVVYKVNTAYSASKVRRSDAERRCAVRRPGEPGVAVPELLECAVGDARGRQQSVQGGVVRELCVRRTDGRPTTEASAGRRDGQILMVCVCS